MKFRNQELSLIRRTIVGLTIAVIGLAAFSCRRAADNSVAVRPDHNANARAISTRRHTFESALAELQEGNRRFQNSHRTRSTDTAHDAELRHETAAQQHPLVALLCCADSRVCPEFIFDQTPGSIFEIRNAGNVVDEDVLASFEYAVEHLEVPLLVVMGHKGCGAVTAVYEAGDAMLPEHLAALQQHMSLVREHAHAHDMGSNLDSLCSQNARQQSELLLANSKLLSEAVAKGETRVVYATYDMESGVVEFAAP